MRGTFNFLHDLILVCAGILLLPASATYICMGCRPVDLQNAPGLGVHLAVGYGTAAIRLSNGTLIDVAKIDASPAYLAAMKELVEDAARVRAGYNSTLPIVRYYRPSEPEYTSEGILITKLRSIWRQVVQGMTKIRGEKTAIIPNDTRVAAIAEMIRSLRFAVESRHVLSYNKLVLSMPTFIAPTRNTHEDIFYQSAWHAGLDPYGHRFFGAYAAMKQIFDIFHCPEIHVNQSTYAPDIACESYQDRQISNVLAIEYSGESLGIMYLPRRGGFFFYDDSPMAEEVDLGANCSLRTRDPEQYWAEVRKLISSLCQSHNRPIDLLVLYGDRATDPELLDLVKDLFRSNTNVKIEEYLRTPDDHMFAAARTAAEEARIGMMGGFDACIWDEYCPRGEEPWPPGMEWWKLDEGSEDIQAKEEL